MVAKKMIGAELTTELGFAQRLFHRQPGPQHPQAGLAQALFARPALQPAPVIEIRGQLLDEDVINGLRRGLCLAQKFRGGGLSPQTLEIPVTGGPRQHVQEFKMARQMVALRKLLSQSSRQGGKIAGGKWNGNPGHRLSFFEFALESGSLQAWKPVALRRSGRDCRWSLSSDSAQDKVSVDPKSLAGLAPLTGPRRLGELPTVFYSNSGSVSPQ
ncbi:MAG: hypothetical protein QM757_06980 [Paludibaculum sp.]